MAFRKFIWEKSYEEGRRKGRQEAVCIRHPYVKPTPDAEDVFCENCGWWICHSGMCANPDCV